MNKAYERINWENKPSTATPLSATNLNKMDLALDTIDDRVIDLDTNKADKSIVKAGNPITFNITDGGVFDKAEVEFSPIQDLHGYDNPWVGSAGKNKLDVSSVVGTLNGVTFAINTNGSVSVTGTATADVWQPANSNFTLTPSAEYKVNGLTATIRMRIREYDSNNTVINEFTVNNTETTFTVNANTVKCDAFIRIASGVVTNTTIYPMIRLSTETSDTFEPYENICPITGYTELNIFQSNGSTTTPDDTYTQSLGGTYYGGTYDFATGKLTIDKGYVDLGSLNWAIQSGVTGGFNTLISDMKKGVTGTKANIISSIFNVVETKSPVATMMADGDGIMGVVNTYSTLVVKDTSKSSMTENQFKAAMDGVQFVYELATPILIDLTPTQISALVGDNVMWTGGDKVTVRISTLVDSEYVTYDNTSSGLTATNVQDAIDELKALISALGS